MEDYAASKNYKIYVEIKENHDVVRCKIENTRLYTLKTM